MQRIRLDRHGAGSPDDVALKGDQTDRGDDGHGHDHETDTAVLDRRRIDQPIARLDQQKHSRSGDEGALAHGR